MRHSAVSFSKYFSVALQRTKEGDLYRRRNSDDSQDFRSRAPSATCPVKPRDEAQGLKFLASRPLDQRNLTTRRGQGVEYSNEVGSASGWDLAMCNWSPMPNAIDGCVLVRAVQQWSLGCMNGRLATTDVVHNQAGHPIPRSAGSANGLNNIRAAVGLGRRRDSAMQTTGDAVMRRA